MDDNKQITLAVLQAQVITEQSYVAYFDARIKSGAYKDRKVWHGLQRVPENLYSEKELLNDELNTMYTHIKRMHELTESMMDLRK